MDLHNNHHVVSQRVGTVRFEPLRGFGRCKQGALITRWGRLCHLSNSLCGRSTCVCYWFLPAFVTGFCPASVRLLCHPIEMGGCCAEGALSTAVRCLSYLALGCTCVFCAWLSLARLVRCVWFVGLGVQGWCVSLICWVHCRLFRIKKSATLNEFMDILAENLVCFVYYCLPYSRLS